MGTITQEMLAAAWWSDARQCWVLEDKGARQVATIPCDVLPGSEHPRHYSPDELAKMVILEE